jgi:sterol desaturase/sphingolipid hydroxylase (fatty acid hydroxylase superfamily)
MELAGSLFAKIVETLLIVLPSVIGFAIAFTVLSLFSSQTCNPGRPWWRNPGLATDICYMLIIPFVAPYMRISLMIAGAALLSGVMTAQEISDYFAFGRGPLAMLPFWAQVPIYVVASDFLLYWTHRLFHGAPVALPRDPSLGGRGGLDDGLPLPPGQSVARLVPGDGADAVSRHLADGAFVPGGVRTTTAAFVHANLNWTLGPLKYVVATPVFHRWHHTPLDQGGNSNFGSLLSVWDVLFGTFHMPAHALPGHYGIDDANFPAGCTRSAISSRALYPTGSSPTLQRFDLPDRTEYLKIEQRPAALARRLRRIARHPGRLRGKQWNAGEIDAIGMH